MLRIERDWAQSAVFYQIYPLGFCGAPFHNDGVEAHRIQKVKEWIPHLEKLGIGAVYFSPVFESDSHGYDTRDYRKIDCRLGTNEDFQEVCQALHEAGIRVVLDGVFNHVGRGFWAFRDVQEKREASPYKDWFHINFGGNSGYNDGFWYEGWEGHFELVKLNLQNPAVVDYLLDNRLCSEEEARALEMLRRLHASTDGSSVGIAAQDDVFDPLTCVGGVIKLENGALRQSIDIRFPTSTNAETLCAALSKLAQDAGGSFLPDSARVPFYIDPNTPVIQTLIRTYNDVTGKNAQPFTMGGGTYARHFKCAVSFGMEETGEPAPEWVGPMHGPDEGVSEALLFKALKIYILAIARLMQLEF